MKSEHRAESGHAERDSSDAPLEHQRIGGYLKRQRELRGVSAEELARTTRIPLRSIERLESGSFDGEVDGFVRGFVRTVAVALGLDPNETVGRMLAEPRPEPPVRHRNSIALPRAIVGLAVVLLLALAIGLIRVVADGESPAVAGHSDDVVRRRDPVRALAESQAGSAVGSPGPVVPARPIAGDQTRR
jgi:hypothetical protein